MKNARVQNDNNNNIYILLINIPPYLIFKYGSTVIPLHVCKNQGVIQLSKTTFAHTHTDTHIYANVDVDTCLHTHAHTKENTWSVET